MPKIEKNKVYFQKLSKNTKRKNEFGKTRTKLQNYVNKEQKP